MKDHSRRVRRAEDLTRHRSDIRPNWAGSRLSPQSGDAFGGGQSGGTPTAAIAPSQRSKAPGAVHIPVSTSLIRASV